MERELTIAEAANQLNMPEELLRRLIKRREFPERLTVAQCEAYVEKWHRVEPGSLTHLYRGDTQAEVELLK